MQKGVPMPLGRQCRQCGERGEREDQLRVVVPVSFGEDDCFSLFVRRSLGRTIR
jgi:hypothetical protein